jgi:hypothetical protein
VSIEAILVELKKEREKLDQAIALLEELESPRSQARPSAIAVGRNQQQAARGMPPATRKRLLVAMKKRWQSAGRLIGKVHNS